MKKSLITISLFALVLSASAQFKVSNEGKVSINCTGSSDWYLYCNNTNSKNGLYFLANGNNSSSTIYGGRITSSNATQSIGLKGSANGISNSIGVLGNADAGTKAIGIVGSINQGNSTTGAGVYGTIYNESGSGLSTGEKYAGFFRGNVKVIGSIVTSSTIQGALLGQSSSSTGSSGSGQSLRALSATSGLSGLHVTTYQKERPAPIEDTETILDPDEDSTRTAEVVQPETDIMDEQFYTKNHYALDADRLEEAFPDLVYVNKDGSKAINYVEMIPLLVQSINELSEKIEELQGQASGKSASRGETGIESSFATKNKLYQNTPNPFKEQTTIRFSLADDVNDATICIFDMAGKTIKKIPVSSGMESVSFGGYELGEGMFLYSLIVNGQEIDTKKMIITK